MDNEQSTSPTPIRPDVHVDFYVALKAIMDGAYVTKAEWNNKETYGYLREGKLTLFRDNKDFDWILIDGDVAGEDWIVL